MLLLLRRNSGLHERTIYPSCHLNVFVRFVELKQSFEFFQIPSVSTKDNL